jgi:glycosidase
MISALFLLFSSSSHAEEVILQYFGTGWNDIAERIPELAEAGYTALWLPPPFKAGAGIWSVGFDTYDRFDVGSKDQMGSVQTKYGTETELIHLVEVAHRFGFRVYFDNVMAHNGGPMMEGAPGTLNDIGFVPEDFHLIRTSDTTYQNPDWPTWSDEWQVLNRNPFGQDIAQEDPNDSFGWSEGDDYAKWSGTRHPDNPEYYPDTDLDIQFTNDVTTFTLNTYANKEPYEDIGYTNSSGTYVSNALWNGRFDWEDTNGNGQHDAGENCEPFSDTGIDPSRSDHLNTAWGYGDGIYNMGNPYNEDVNSMLYRAVRWFVDRVKPDGFRLDAVKHVPAYFFGKMDDPKDDSDWGYGGQIQVQFNVSRGYSDWDNHRDTVFNNTQARDDALLYGEHLGDPPAKENYVAAGMRIANDDFLNAVKGNIGSDLQGMDSSYYGIISPGQSMLYVMSHDNNYLWGGDREQAHAILLTREGLPIVYTDGYNQSGAPDWFPKPAEVPFLGQFDSDWLPNLLDINRHFGWGYQSSRYSAWDYSSYTRYDEDLGNNDHGVYMVFAMAKNYISGWPQMQGAATFPDGARLFNYSIYNNGLQVKVESGNIVNMDGSAIYLAPNEYYAFSWRIPNMPSVWGNDLTNAVRPIMIFENGRPVGTVTVTRTDGRDGDPAFNPYDLPDSDSTDYAYRIDLPRVTSATNLAFIARGDGSTENIMMKLDGGIDLNSQLSIVTQDYGDRDNPPAATKDKFLGYEQMQYIQRAAEKFAAGDVARNIIGSLGAETYLCTIGSAGLSSVDGSGVDTDTGTANWAYHDPAAVHHDGSTLQFTPAPESAAGQPVTLWVKIGYSGEVNRAFIYYTTNGTNPEGSMGIGKDTTEVAEMSFQVQDSHDGGGYPQWWSGTLPALPAGTALRYKIAAFHNDASSRFPWSDDDLSVIPYMETMFEITNFNAATVPYYPHNDWGEMAVGLREGFHILRTKCILGRATGDTDIYRENTQTFYFDAAAPTGRYVFPAVDNMTLEDADYKVVVRSDMTVEEAWYKIEDMDADNDDSETGLDNGNGAWVRAEQATLGSPDTGGNPEKQWEFDYVSIPTSGTATIRVLLRELTSSTNRSLADAEGHFTTLLRTVDTGGSGVRLVITQPTGDGRTLGAGSNLTARFSKTLGDGLDDAALLDCFELLINGSSATPGTQTLTRAVTTNEHQVQVRLPNFYNGDPDFLHTLAMTYTRDGYPSLQAQRQAYSTVNADSNSDGIPDAWELQWGLSAMTLSPAADYDSDGVNDYLEYLANTDPTDDEVYFAITDTSIKTNGDLSLLFPASFNRDYYVWITETLSVPTNWTRYSETPMAGSGQVTEYAVPITNVSHRFYRLEVTFPE